MNAQSRQLWDEAVRQHDHKVFLSLLALGLAPDRAREVAQAAWARLVEQEADGKLPELHFPGLAIRQARFLALNELSRDKSEARLLRAVPPPGESVDLEQVAASKQRFDRLLDALGDCSPMARKVFRLAYTEPHTPHAEIAQSVGLSLQRVRQILCETRNALRLALQEEQ